MIRVNSAMRDPSPLSLTVFCLWAEEGVARSLASTIPDLSLSRVAGDANLSSLSSEVK